jgi:hypothetical protein
MKAYYLTSLKTDDPSPRGLIHQYDHGNSTVCGKELDGSWYIVTDRSKLQVNCKKCLKKRRVRKKGETHGQS